MNRNKYNFMAAVAAAAWMAAGTAIAQTSQQDREVIHPSPRSSVGGSQSERTDSGAPIGRNQFSGTTEMGRANSVNDVMETQEALKNEGYDPGPMDGIMGAQTREALKKFQRANGLSITGTLDQWTAEKLGVNFGGPSDRGADIDRAQERSNYQSR